jgi:calcineurin-like phosphoesterase family protein
MSNLYAPPRHGGPKTIAAAILALAALAVTGCNREASPAQRQTPAITAAPPAPTRPPAEVLTLPRKPGSVRFAAIGDSGRGDPPQYEISAQMQAYRKVFSYDFVVMLGDNVYDGGTPEYYRDRFELPYKPLLDDGVKFYATIGNHDYPNQPFYPPFNMGGERYYTFKPPSLVARLAGTGDNVRFFMIDTELLDRPQLEWIDREMGRSESDWKIPIFHRPLYTSGRYARSARALRAALEPLFVKHGVKVAFSGHEHFYERMKPQQGITYFISGGAGSLRVGDIRPTDLTDAGFDRDYHFMLIEISGDELFYQAISRTGATVDAGVVRRTPATSN